MWNYIIVIIIIKFKINKYEHLKKKIKSRIQLSSLLYLLRIDTHTDTQSNVSNIFFGNLKMSKFSHVSKVTSQFHFDLWVRIHTNLWNSVHPAIPWDPYVCIHTYLSTQPNVRCSISANEDVDIQLIVSSTISPSNALLI